MVIPPPEPLPSNWTINDLLKPDYSNVSQFHYSLFTQNWGDKVELSFSERSDGYWIVSGCFLVAIYAYGGMSKYTFDAPHVEPTSYPFVCDFPLIEHRVYPNFITDSTEAYFNSPINGVPNIEFWGSYIEETSPESGYDIVDCDISGITFTETGIVCPDVWDRPVNFPFEKPLKWINRNCLLLVEGFNVYYYPDKTKTEVKHRNISSDIAPQMQPIPEYGELCLRMRQSSEVERIQFTLVVKSENEEFEGTGEVAIMYNYREFDTDGMIVIYPNDTLSTWHPETELPSFGLGYGQLTSVPRH